MAKVSLEPPLSLALSPRRGRGDQDRAERGVKSPLPRRGERVRERGGSSDTRVYRRGKRTVNTAPRSALAALMVPP
jgi:hypothetical protein